MPAKRRAKAVLIPSSPAYSFPASKQRPSADSDPTPGPGAYNIHGESKVPYNGPLRVHTHDRGNVIASPDYHTLSTLRSSPAFPIGSKACSSRKITTPGPGEYNPDKTIQNPKHPAYSLRSKSEYKPKGKQPGPEKYNWGQSVDKLHPEAATAVTMKFRRCIPGDKMRRPGPDEYSPKDPLELYKGEYKKCTLKFRHRKKLSDMVPDPGPGHYSPNLKTRPKAPAYTVRLKANSGGSFVGPGPGQYDTEHGTIGNWGAGMAGDVAMQPDLFLQERIEMFRIGEPLASDQGFLKHNRKKLLEMRKKELNGTLPMNLFARRSVGGKLHSSYPGESKSKKTYRRPFPNQASSSRDTMETTPSTFLPQR